ncbi:PKD domain-containing protein [Paeniglutamicibacter antarcticus]|uniref:PKD domain-containing protein n=1 Tax=Arthrobacter terrae TaxID=2935737 RepID=A0A931CHA0_9MICC|nr:PKD domain-containing protein [Arthrobacter terrae]MBG0738333.1 PKD domain-containing protein [Arthrobacter terrae]
MAAAAMMAMTGAVGLPAAVADTVPVNPGDPATPVTVSADALPTAQINGVAWQQTIVGDVVYVAGKFTTARPAGAAANSQTVTRNNILAYNLRTGVLINSFTPNLNGQALTITAAPDGSRIYAGGDFTSVNGTSRLRAVALNPATGAVVSSFNPRMGGSVRAIVATNDTVYLGGNFSSVGSSSRSRLAAVRASDGSLLAWNPNANAMVNALALGPDASQVVVGGAFTTLNGSNRPGYGLGRVDARTGASLPFAANDVVRDAGNQSAILSLSSDGTTVYGTGYIYGTGGNLEGGFAANWSTGNIKWVEDCHGDSYGIWASSTAVYSAGHAHYCGNLRGFPEVTPRAWHRAVSFSKAVTGVLTKDTQGYPSFTGVAAPSLLNWFPDLDTGTVTGQNQGPWAVVGTEQYVAMAGEFRNVNGRAQQGLVRFAVKEIAPNAEGPRVSGANTNPVLSYTRPGEVRVQWQTNWDRDNENLTYQVIRDANTAAPAYTVSKTSTFWDRPNLEFSDKGLTAGTHAYRIFASDPTGNVVRSDTVNVNVPVGGAGPPSNTAPVASFTSVADGLTLSVDGSASTDADGTVVGYTWDFGDGGSATGATAAHSYGAAGTYAVRLSVVDNGGAANSVVRSVTVSADGPPPVNGILAQDTFGRTVANGFGTAEKGGAWSLNGSASLFAVADGSGTITPNRGAGPSAYLDSVAAVGTDSRVSVSLDKIPAGSGAYVWLAGRSVGASGTYLAKANVTSSGAVRLDVSRKVGGTETSLNGQIVPGLQYVAGTQLRIRLLVSGTAPTTISAKIWKADGAEPAGWQASASDSTASLQAAGSVGLLTYISSGATNTPIVMRFDDYVVESIP